METSTWERTLGTVMTFWNFEQDSLNRKSGVTWSNNSVTNQSHYFKGNWINKLDHIHFNLIWTFHVKITVFPWFFDTWFDDVDLKVNSASIIRSGSRAFYHDTTKTSPLSFLSLCLCLQLEQQYQTLHSEQHVTKVENIRLKQTNDDLLRELDNTSQELVLAQEQLNVLQEQSARLHEEKEMWVVIRRNHSGFLVSPPCSNT